MVEAVCLVTVCAIDLLSARITAIISEVSVPLHWLSGSLKTQTQSTVARSA